MIAIYGGTFDPIHLGHLRSAIEILETLELDELRLVPAFIPPHKKAPTSTSQQRLEMLRLAISDIKGLVVDDRELKRQGPSYSVDTLASIRAEIGSQTSLVMVMGFDAFARLNSWHEWQRLGDLAHLVILERPGFSELTCHKAVSDWAESRWTDTIGDLQMSACGRIYGVRLAQLEISASMIRARLGENKKIDFLVPDQVKNYIRLKQLYQASASQD